MFFKHLWPALLGSTAVLILCVLPGQSFPEVGLVNFDKFVHSLLFAGLTFLFARGFYLQSTFQFLNRYYLITAFALCTLYGGLLEILQATVAVNRSGDWLDFVFDGLGAMAAAGILSSTTAFLRYGIPANGISLQVPGENEPR